jgi:hypothetical protein
MESPNYKLSRNEIDFIKDDVKKSEISFSHLEEELVDHLCCMVEELINDGYSFDKAFNSVRKEVGMDSLKAIEIQTLILINKKFHAMKQTMKISGIIGLSAIVISSLMKIMHWPGANIILTLGFATLLLAYLPALSLTLKKEKILKRKMQLSYVGIITAFVLLLSLLFSIMNWPFGDYLRAISWAMMLVFLIMLYSNVMKSEESRVLNLSMLLFFALIFVINVSRSFLDIKNPRLSKFTIENNFEASIKLFEHKTDNIYKQFDTIKNNTSAREIAEIKTSTSEVIGKIEQIKNALFASKAEHENFNKHLLKDDKITNDIENQAWKLDTEILPAYRKFMNEKTKLHPDLNSFIETSIQFGQLEFNNNPQVIYNNLQKLIRDIKIAENELLIDIQKSIILKNQ